MRKPRMLLPNAKYHVAARINRGQCVFKPDEIKILFMNTLKRSRRKYKFALYNFVIMDNYIRFIIQPLENESLSRIMQWVLSVFAMHFNINYKLHGHVWQERFWSEIINDISHFIKTFNDISENPVKKGIVSNGSDYKFKRDVLYSNG